jgi:hypothetical protein
MQTNLHSTRRAKQSILRNGSRSEICAANMGGTINMATARIAPTDSKAETMTRASAPMSP